MSLAEIWFVLFAAVIGGYIVLDGFDLGVGMLHPFAAKEDRERRIVLHQQGARRFPTDRVTAVTTLIREAASRALASA